MWLRVLTIQSRGLRPSPSWRKFLLSRRSSSLSEIFHKKSSQYRRIEHYQENRIEYVYRNPTANNKTVFLPRVSSVPNLSYDQIANYLKQISHPDTYTSPTDEKKIALCEAFLEKLKNMRTVYTDEEMIQRIIHLASVQYVPREEYRNILRNIVNTIDKTKAKDWPAEIYFSFFGAYSRLHLRWDNFSKEEQDSLLLGILTFEKNYEQIHYRRLSYFVEGIDRLQVPSFPTPEADNLYLMIVYHLLNENYSPYFRDRKRVILLQILTALSQRGITVTQLTKQNIENILLGIENDFPFIFLNDDRKCILQSLVKLQFHYGKELPKDRWEVIMKSFAKNFDLQHNRLEVETFAGILDAFYYLGYYWEDMPMELQEGITKYLETLSSNLSNERPNPDNLSEEIENLSISIEGIPLLFRGIKKLKIPISKTFEERIWKYLHSRVINARHNTNMIDELADLEVQWKDIPLVVQLAIQSQAFRLLEKNDLGNIRKFHELTLLFQALARLSFDFIESTSSITNNDNHQNEKKDTLHPREHFQNLFLLYLQDIGPETVKPLRLQQQLDGYLIFFQFAKQKFSLNWKDLPFTFIQMSLSTLLSLTNVRSTLSTEDKAMIRIKIGQIFHAIHALDGLETYLGSFVQKLNKRKTIPLLSTVIYDGLSVSLSWKQLSTTSKSEVYHLFIRQLQRHELFRDHLKSYLTEKQLKEVERNELKEKRRASDGDNAPSAIVAAGDGAGTDFPHDQSMKASGEKAVIIPKKYASLKDYSRIIEALVFMTFDYFANPSPSNEIIQEFVHLHQPFLELYFKFIAEANILDTLNVMSRNQITWYLTWLRSLPPSLTEPLFAAVTPDGVPTLSLTPLSSSLSSSSESEGTVLRVGRNITLLCSEIENLLIQRPLPRRLPLPNFILPTLLAEKPQQEEKQKEQQQPVNLMPFLSLLQKKDTYSVISLFSDFPIQANRMYFPIAIKINEEVVAFVKPAVLLLEEADERIKRKDEFTKHIYSLFYPKIPIITFQPEILTIPKKREEFLDDLHQILSSLPISKPN